ncbi:hypothetical protein COU57_02280 [Candidatus Pacearchaeota archaeon CG10_big_fil_rev_8_21_14_0_10_32_14]|nr:MAG: hypothetical protein COU57_02280 [Candidatus Pacearchaeota archaeon CG10_big_fil_rev_8_21_14_0_10_32_14]
MVWKICNNCGKEKEMHSKDLCTNCYKKIMWKLRLAKCTRCKVEKPVHARGLCVSCYNSVFHLEKNKAWNQKKNYGLDYEVYKKITENCVVCNFNKVVDLHHLDENKKNNDPKNLLGLCPNHHKMLHDFRYRKEMRDSLKEKGYDLPIDLKLDFERN